MISRDLSPQKSYGEALVWGRRLLAEAESPTPGLDARVLLEHLSGIDRASMIALEYESLGDDLAPLYAAALNRRAAGEPVAYITRRQAFWEHTFEVGPGVLIPRPETEMLVDAALLLDPPPARVLDLGTGSGCLLLSVLDALPDAAGVGIDASLEALTIARRNRHRLGLTRRADLRLLSFVEARETLLGQPFDLILANPPYIPENTSLPTNVGDHEPPGALFAGDDGLSAHRECASLMASCLAQNGSAFIEIGHDQGSTAMALYQAALTTHMVRTHRDGSGHPRMVAVRPPRGL